MSFAFYSNRGTHGTW